MYAKLCSSHVNNPATYNYLLMSLSLGCFGLKCQLCKLHIPSPLNHVPIYILQLQNCHTFFHNLSNKDLSNARHCNYNILWYRAASNSLHQLKNREYYINELIPTISQSSFELMTSIQKTVHVTQWPAVPDVVMFSRVLCIPGRKLIHAM